MQNISRSSPFRQLCIYQVLLHDLATWLPFFIVRSIPVTQILFQTYSSQTHFKTSPTTYLKEHCTMTAWMAHLLFPFSSRCTYFDIASVTWLYSPGLKFHFNTTSLLQPLCKLILSKALFLCPPALAFEEPRALCAITSDTTFRVLQYTLNMRLYSTIRSTHCTQPCT